jgi:mRNA interferase MazF
MLISRGSIFMFDFGPRRDKRIEGPHPAIIVQSDRLNGYERYELTIIVPVTSKSNDGPTRVPIAPTAESGLKKESWAKCEQIYTVPKEELGKRLGRVSPSELFEIVERIGHVIGP